MFNDLNDLNIKRLIQLAEKEQILLPEFQRPFVWDKSQIKLLIDSLFNNYTISSILVWKWWDELARRRVWGSLKDIKYPEWQTGADINYLLDGQQRTTALMLVFTDKKVYKGTNTKKPEVANLYFDSTYFWDDSEQKFIYWDECIEWEETELDTLDEKEIYEKYGSRFIKLKYVYDDDGIGKIMKLVNLENSELFADIYKKIRNLQESILDRKVIAVNQTGKLSDVLSVFERINTQNTKLNMFDIMVAKTYKKLDNEGYFDLRKYASMVLFKKRPWSFVWNDYAENLNLELEKTERYIDELTLLFLILVILKQEFIQKNILLISTNDLIDNTKSINKTINRIYDFFTENCLELEKIKDFKPISKFLAWYFSIILEKDDTWNLRNALNKWFWNTIIYNRYPGAQNERVQRDLKIFEESIDQLNNFTDKIKQDRFKTFDTIRNSDETSLKIFDAYYSDKGGKLYKSLITLLKRNKPQDFNVWNLVNGNNSDNLEEHHIFPDKSVIGRFIKEIYKDNSELEDIVNNIANIALINSSTNKSIISNRDPKDYILDLEKNNQKDFLAIMESQFITEDMVNDLKNNEFENFFFKRTKLILQKIDQMCE